jgi:hypothetical protein
MMQLLIRGATVAIALFLLVSIGLPAAVHLANVFTPTGVIDYAWTVPALLGQLMQGVPFPASTQLWAFLMLAATAAVAWALFAIAGAFQPDGRASILRLRFVVWWRSKPKRAPLTAKAAEPLGRIGWFGFLGIRWFTDMLEETRVLIAPSGAGKTVRLVVQLVLRAQGAIVTTSTKPDVLQLTGWVRRMQHPFAQVMAFDPEGLVPWMGERRVKWDIIAGCEDGQVAMKRAAAIVAARPIDGKQSTNAGFFTQAVTIVLQCMMHAAAVGGKSMRDVMAWMGDYSNDTPYEILRTHPKAIHSWEQQLTKYCRGKAEETVSSTDMSASGILNAFSLEQILDTVCPVDGDPVVDITRHHRTRDSLYLICKGEDSPAASVFTALVDSLYLAASDDVTRTGICVPPLELILDEAMNVCSIPSLPRLMSTGRGEGIVPTIILQDYPQLVERYGPSKATTIINNATQLLVMGGLKDNDFLQQMSALAGSLDQLGRGWAQQVLAPEKIRTLRTGRAVFFYRNQPPAIITLPPWWRSPHRGEYQASLDWAAAAHRDYDETLNHTQTMTGATR